MRCGGHSKRTWILLLVCIVAIMSGCTLNTAPESDSVILTATLSQPPTLAAVIQTNPPTVTTQGLQVI